MRFMPPQTTTCRRETACLRNHPARVPKASRIVPQRGEARMTIECAPITTTARNPGNVRRPIRISSTDAVRRRDPNGSLPILIQLMIG